MSVRLITSAAPGGVAVLELAGRDAHRRLAELTGGAPPAPGDLRLTRLRRASTDEAAAEDLDEALLVGVGEARTELHLHGSPPLVEEVLELLGGTHEGKTLEQRAEALYAEAQTELAARVLVDQAHGALRAALEAARADATGESFRLLHERGRALAPLFAPLRVALVGPANAGKSTLFNLLVGEERAVVSSLAGTTRDAVGAPGRLGAWPAYFIDTAGERDVEGSGQADVERSGQALAQRVADAADVRLRLTAANEGGLEGAARSGAAIGLEVRLRSLADLVLGLEEASVEFPADWPSDAISAQERPAATRARVEAALLEALGLPPRPAWEAGCAVPFDPELLAAVQCASEGDVSRVEAFLSDGL